MKKDKQNNETFNSIMDEIGKKGVDDLAKGIDDATDQLTKMMNDDEPLNLNVRYKLVKPKIERDYHP